jgi:protein SCO1/2
VTRRALLAALVLLTACAGATPQTLPAFVLTNQSGQLVRAEDLRGRVTVVSFLFTTCRDVCPLMTAQLARVQAQVRAEGLASRVGFVSISVDPVTDTPDVLARYAAGFGASLATWHFLTGPPDEVGRLLRELDVVTGSGGAVGHSTVVLFVDGEGRIAERSTEIDLDPERVLPKIRRLLG